MSKDKEKKEETRSLRDHDTLDLGKLFPFSDSPAANKVRAVLKH